MMVLLGELVRTLAVGIVRLMIVHHLPAVLPMVHQVHRLNRCVLEVEPWHLHM